MYLLVPTCTYTSVVAKKLGYWLKIKLRRLKEGVKCVMLSVEVPIVLYRVIPAKNPAGDRCFLFSWQILLAASAYNTTIHLRGDEHYGSKCLAYEHKK